MKKINLKSGDIVEIIDIHPNELDYPNRDKYIGTRRIVTDKHGIREASVGDGFLYIAFNSISAFNIYELFTAIKVKKVRVLNPKNKKK